ncbi:unnamed protein product [Phyllotreta striolata]|uniref:NADPH:adrenodoxin oxidoreductase, mitochondrial n=1 Tax=Phyllotreta striolata TaxID=444603 RepID=A0A9N9THX6_PHYSR|nr:unnamed protein product [Phyllotreta striolata]
MTFIRPCLLLKRYFGSKPNNPKICIVGAGPAGFYAAQHLIKKLKSCEVDIIEKLPVPFGLVRFGVAPDHPEVKNVINTFNKVGENPFVRFLGNVTLGRDVSLRDLQNAYHVVLLTYGAEKSKTLGIPGEHLANCVEARRIVGWYNGLPWDKNLKIDLSKEVVAIFGQGNVAIDVARILLSPVDELKKTDITQYALEALSMSKVKRVFLVGRRGPLQAAYTIKELREMLKLKTCSTIWRAEDFKGVADHIPHLARPKKRITELMLKSLNEPQTPKDKEFRPIFFRSPLSISGSESVEKVVMGINKLEGDNILEQKAVLTDGMEELNAGLIVPSIGYKSIQVDENIPFDGARGLVKNNNFRVNTGLYVSGWLGTGPTGVILTTMSNAFEVAENIIEDIQSEHLAEDAKGGIEDITPILALKNVQTVNWMGWEKINRHEQFEGNKLGKPREKVVDIEKMLAIASS